MGYMLGVAEDACVAGRMEAGESALEHVRSMGGPRFTHVQEVAPPILRG